MVGEMIMKMIADENYGTEILRCFRENCFNLHCCGLK